MKNKIKIPQKIFAFGKNSFECKKMGLNKKQWEALREKDEGFINKNKE